MQPARRFTLFVLSGSVPKRHHAGRSPMANSKTIAGLIGPTLIALAAALFVNLGSISALVEPVAHDPALVLVSGVVPASVIRTAAPALAGGSARASIRSRAGRLRLCITPKSTWNEGVVARYC